jgi:3-hydroxyisobutyrate dehydrogenase-like beta-hydroxyacid dehydrogenase
MSPSVAIVAQGAMGTAVALRLVKHGARVVTCLEGRSSASRARALAAGMDEVALDRLAEADFVLSIVPPVAALPFARQMAEVIRAAARKPLFVDCNAVSPATVQEIGAVIAASGAPFVDGSIIGIAPKPEQPSPHLYVSGDQAGRLRVLAAHGLDLRVLDGPVGAASALKMAFAGISKGTLAVATAMILAATRAGAAQALHRELAESESAVLASLAHRIPGTLAKAWRWEAEMQEIAGFAGEDASAARIFEGASALFARIAADVAGESRETAALLEFFRRPPGAS